MEKIKAVRNGTRVLFQCRASYVHLSEPWSGAENNEKKYSVCAIVPKSDEETVALLREAAQQAYDEGVAAKWGGVKPNPNASGFRKPIKDGDVERPDDEAFRGSVYVNCSSGKDRQPATLNRAKERIDPREVYSGCWVILSVNFYAFNQGSKGVTCALNAVLKFADGEPLGGGGDGSRDFDGLDLPPMPASDLSGLM